MKPDGWCVVASCLRQLPYSLVIKAPPPAHRRPPQVGLPATIEHRKQPAQGDGGGARRWLGSRRALLLLLNAPSCIGVGPRTALLKLGL